MRKFLLCAICFVAFFTAAFGQTPRPTPLISIPDINGRAISLVQPAFPETAVAVGADGNTVGVLVVVDENGSVISAQCATGCPTFLKDAAELAASNSKFRPLIIGDTAVKYEGVLMYTFVVERVDWFFFGTALESVRQFDNISLGPVVQILSSRFVAEKNQLLSLDAKGVDYDSRQNGIRAVEISLKDKLKGGDLWRFEIGMALRRVSFWEMASEQIDRLKLQTAINELPRYINGAPDGISKQTIDALKAVSEYKVSHELTERNLRQAITKLTLNIRIEP